MLSFEERMAILDAALAEHTPESLFNELSEFPAYGPSLASYCVEISEKVTVIEPSNVDLNEGRNTSFSSSPLESEEYSEAA